MKKKNQSGYFKFTSRAEALEALALLRANNFNFVPEDLASGYDYGSFANINFLNKSFELTIFSYSGVYAYLTLKDLIERLKPKARKNYNVVSTFDSMFPSQGLSPANIDTPVYSPYAKEILPNVPLKAKNTLLAKFLKNGTFTEINQYHTYVNAYRIQDAVRYLRSRRKPFVWVKEREGTNPHKINHLVGKLIGVEIEYYPEDSSKIKKSALTILTDDGSLSSGGAEIRKLTWASNSGRLEGLLSLNLRGRVDRKCGLHVHVDARHLGRNGLLTAAQTYDRLCDLMPFLKKLVPKSRLDNKYCEWVNNRKDSGDYECPDNGERYAAINFESYYLHKTIEFRCQSGTIKLIKIESWALLCQFLVNWVAKDVNCIPYNWDGFVAILPEPLRSWVILREMTLYKEKIEINERSSSALFNEVS